MTDRFPWFYNVIYVTTIFVAFAFVHSLCVTETIKKLITSLLGDQFVKGVYRFLFTVFSVVTLGLCVFLVHSISDHTIILLNGVPWLMFHLLQLAGLIIGGLAFSNINIGEFLGLSQFMTHMRYGRADGDEEGLRDNRLITSGVYGLVRHPLYLAGILIFTFNPYITVNTLTITLLADLYFIFGAFVEEHRLEKRFGSEYIEYRKKVPRLVPRVRRKDS